MKILLLDDHLMFSKSLGMALETFSEVSKVEYFYEVSSLEEYLKAKLPDVLLLDIRLENQNGLYIGEALLKKYADLKIIFLSGFDAQEYHNRAISMGAKGFINKNVSIDILMAAIKKVVLGEELYNETEKESFNKLTNMEKEILKLMAEGLKQEAIGEKLDITRRTVNTHIRNILVKLEVNSSLQAVLKAIEFGIIEMNNL